MTKPWKKRKYVKLNNDKYEDLLMHTSTINGNTNVVLPIKNIRNYNYLNFYQTLTIIENTKLTLPIKNRRNYNSENDPETENQCYNDQETNCFHVSSPKLYMRDLTQNDLYFLEYYKYQGINAQLRNQHVVNYHYNTQKLVLWSPDF